MGEYRKERWLLFCGNYYYCTSNTQTDVKSKRSLSQDKNFFMMCQFPEKTFLYRSTRFFPVFFVCPLYPTNLFLVGIIRRTEWKIEPQQEVVGLTGGMTSLSTARIERHQHFSLSFGWVINFCQTDNKRGRHQQKNLETLAIIGMMGRKSSKKWVMKSASFPLNHRSSIQGVDLPNSKNSS